MVADVDVGASGSPDWKSVLVGSMNAGGRGYFALDISNPANFSVANAASLLLWEFSSADDTDMGYTFNLAPANPFTGQAMQIVKMENGKWAAVLGNGYDSPSGAAVLYVIFIKEGVDGVWTAGSDYIKLVAPGGAGNGLSAPVPFDSDGNGMADVIYAGDLNGNMWKFDVSADNPAGTTPALPALPKPAWGVALGGVPLFAAGATKPITSPPVITLHPQGGQLVLFGTGKYLETGDTTNTNTQTMYGIWDSNAAVTSGQLISQTVTPGVFQTATQNPVAYSTVAPIVKGWYLNLPSSGERLTGIPGLENGQFTFTTITPSTSPCDFGGNGLVYTLDYYTGGMLTYPIFDTNGDGEITSGDSLSAGMSIGFSPGGVTRVRGDDSDILVSSKADGTLVKTPTAKGPNILRGRINWREIIQ